MTNPNVDFYGYEFEAEIPLFGTEFVSLPGIYIVYTPKIYLEIGSTENLQVVIEENNNTREWIKLAGGEEILVAFRLDNNEERRKEKEAYLKSKMKPPLD